LLERRSGALRDRIPLRDPAEPCLLSFSQQRLWFLDEWSPGAPTYNAALAFRVVGELDTAALRAAFETIVGRHESLRTVFRSSAGEPEQVVLDRWELDFAVLDLRAAPESDESIRALLRERARRSFDLANDLMLRVTVLRLAGAEWMLQLEEHHIAFDGWSDGVLFTELEEILQAGRDGRPPQLPELPIQYGDFAVWQRRRLEGEALEQQRAYWRGQLAGAPSALALPLDRRRPAVQTFEGRHLPVELDRQAADRVRAFCRAEGVTPFMALLAAFGVLLYRVTGSDDVVVGSPIANRSHVDLEHLIGFFSNTLALRVRMAGNPSFRELTQRVRETALGAYAHGEFPFERLVEAVRPARDAAVNPLFQVNFRVQPEDGAPPSLPGVEMSKLDVDVGFSRFDLALELQLGAEGIGGYLEYNVELFSEETMRRLAGELGALLDQLLALPDTPLLEIKTATGEFGRAKAGRAGPFRRARAGEDLQSETHSNQER
jgi:hypothetical protein